MHATELHLTIGLPASGKTTWARGWVDAARAGGRSVARVNRDDLRLMLFGRLTGVPEEVVSAAALAAVRALLEAEISVVCDDTNVDGARRAALHDAAAQAGATVVEHAEFMNVPIEECVRRDLARGPLRVGIAEIRRLAAIYRASGHSELSAV